MKEKFVKILVWLGIMAALTLVAMLVWTLVFHSAQSTESLKWLQFMQTIGTFLLPPILCALIWDEYHRPFDWLKMNGRVDGRMALLAIAIMVCAIPAINLLADLNGRIHLPEYMAAWEAKMRAMEDAAYALTQRFLQAENVGMLVGNIVLMALLPAFAEELSFRGTLQQLLGNKHVAIWITAVIFSAIHMQFYGFIPRMLMGAMFGYVFVWTDSLWFPILMHFTNNGIAVLAYYLTGGEEANQSIADTLGAGDTWWLGVISLIVTIALIGLFYTLTKKSKKYEIV